MLKLHYRKLQKKASQYMIRKKHFDIFFFKSQENILIYSTD